MVKINNYAIIAFIACLFLCFQLLTIDQYGQTTDSNLVIDRGEFYFYDYQTLGYEGIYQKIPTAKLRSYGSLYSTIVVASKHYLYDTYQVFSDPIHAYHFPNILASTFAVLFLGIFTYKLWGFWPAIFSMIVLVTCPRFLGHSQTEYKDISTLAFFLPCIAFLYYAVTKKYLVYWLISGILIGLCFCVRAHALLVFPIISLWFALCYLWPPLKSFLKTKDKAQLKKFLKLGLKFTLGIALCLLIAGVTVIACWPYYRVDPVSKFLETFTVMSSYDWSFNEKYLGQIYKVNEMPWHYPLVYLTTTLPLSYLILLLTGLLISLVSLWKDLVDKKTLLLFLLTAVTPPTIQSLMGTATYSGIRHWLLIYPFFAGLIGYTLALGSKYLGKFWIVLIILIFSNQIYQNSKVFPLSYIYFNSLVGSETQAQKLFSLDLRKQAKHHVNTWISTQNSQQEYKVFYSKEFSKQKNNKYLTYKNKKPVYIYEINGAKLAYVYQK